MRFFYLSPLRLLAMKNLLPYYYVKLQTKLCTFLVLFLFLSHCLQTPLQEISLFLEINALCDSFTTV